ncbi:MAG: hypothetical protein AAFX99_04130 [Myxococcota bacterium]
MIRDDDHDDRGGVPSDDDTCLSKLKALAALTPTTRRTQRAVALLLQCREVVFGEAMASAVDLELVPPDTLRRVQLVRRNFQGINPRWMFLAVEHLEQALCSGGLGELGSDPDDAQDGATWIAPDHDDEPI